MNWNNINFFHSKRNLPFRKNVLEIMLRGAQNESPHIFNIRILISSWPRALFASRILNSKSEGNNLKVDHFIMKYGKKR